MTVNLTPQQRTVAQFLVNSGRSPIPGRDLRALLGTSGQLSTKHDFQMDFGYKDDVDFYDLYEIYKRNGVAKAVVNKTANKTWETMPRLLEKEKQHDETGIEAEIRKKFASVRFWQQLKETDKRSLVGEYAGVIFQLKDGKSFDQPVDRVPGGIDGLVSLIPAWEGQLQISEWDQDQKSPTYGQPKRMTFTESSVDSDQGKTRSFYVHPDRVVIWSQDRTTFNDSGLEASYNALVDMVKIRGAGGEGFWKAAKNQPVLEANDNVNFAQLAQMLGTDIEGIPEELDNVVADWSKGFDQSLMLQGMKAYNVAVNLPSTGKDSYEIAAREVAAAWDIPEKVLFGNQTGERASTEDAASWNRTNMARRSDYVIPNIMDVVGRLSQWGIIPDRDWFLEWEALDGATEEQRFDRMIKMADANQKMAATGDAVFTDDEMRAEVNMPPKEDEDFSEIEDEDV